MYESDQSSMPMTVQQFTEAIICLALVQLAARMGGMISSGFSGLLPECAGLSRDYKIFRHRVAMRKAEEDEQAGVAGANE